MSRPTLATIQTKLENIEVEIRDLKVEKVGTDVWVIQHQQLKEDIKDVKHDIENINSYGKWFVTLVAGTIIVAVVTFMLNGGLK